MRNELAECVKRGSTLLDHQQPNWYKNIDLNKLDLSDSDKCILGQTFGNFYENPLVSEFILGHDEFYEFVEDHGFYLLNEIEYRDYGWKLLRELWTDEIKTRQAGYVLAV